MTSISQSQHFSPGIMILQLLDLLIIIVTLWGTSEYFYAWDANYAISSLIGIIVFFLLALNSDLYVMGVNSSIVSVTTTILTQWLGVIFVLVVAGFLFKVSELMSRAAMLTWFTLTPVLLVIIRLILKRTSRVDWLWGTQRLTAAIYGSGPLALEFRDALQTDTRSQITVSGFYDEQTDLPEASSQANGAGCVLLGDAEKLCIDARMRKYSLVILAPGEIDEVKLEHIVEELADSNTRIYFVPDMTMFNMLNSRIHNIGGVPFVEVFYSPLAGAGQIFKRVEDLLVGTLLLAIAALPMAMIAAAIKLESPGPVIFRQQRHGRNGGIIWVWKFRSMTVCESGESAVQATRDDVRITNVGRYLRKFSLDELPQFFNVLHGTMSIVGPRPHPIALNDEYRKSIRGYMLRHEVKPGITGWAQINGWRGETETPTKMEQRVKHDLWYIRNWSVGLDLRIMVATVFRIFNDELAY